MPEESELLKIMETTRSPMVSHRRDWPPALPVSNVRVARATNRLAEVVQFYTAELGLPELDRFSGHAGYDGVMLGLPGPELGPGDVERMVEITCTATGHALRDRVRAIQAQVEHDTGLTGGELATMRTDLHRVAARLRERPSVGQTQRI
jgi:hypothetical protein